MRTISLLLVVLAVGCSKERGTEGKDKAPAPATAPATAPASPGGAATPASASPAGKLFERYLDVTAVMWKEVAAVGEQAERANKFDHARMRNSLEATYKALGEIDSEVARLAADPAFAVDMCIACIERDWNLNGRIDDGDRKLLQVEVDERGNELPETDPRRKPTFRFDSGDLHWARAMLAFQRAGLDLLLAYRWEALDQLLLDKGDEDDQAPAVPPSLTIKLASSARVTSARDLILAGIDHADKCRAAYLAETDDEREWVPSPKQKSHPVPLPLDQAMYDRWAAILGDVRRLVRGEEGLDIGQVGALLDDDFAIFTGFIDVGRLLSRPADFVIELSVFEDDRLEPKQAGEKLLGGLLGAAYVKRMKPSPLPGRLRQMRSEIERDEGELGRKLRYLLWLN